MATITDIKSGAVAQAQDAALAEQSASPQPAVVGEAKPDSTPPPLPKEPISVPADMYPRLKPSVERIATLRRRPLVLLVSSFIDSDTVTKLYDSRNELRKMGAVGPID